MAKVYVIGTMDTKGEELRFAAACARHAGAEPVLVDVGTKAVGGDADVTAAEIAACHPDGAGAVLGLTDRGVAVAGMAEAQAAGARRVIGFEANGGVLLGSEFALPARTLTALPTRDATLGILAILGRARLGNKPLSRVVEALNLLPATSGRLSEIDREAAKAFLARLAESPEAMAALLPECGAVASHTRLDGERFGFANGQVVHFRLSGNAPELRCYVEAATPGEAEALLALALERAQQALGDQG